LIVVDTNLIAYAVLPTADSEHRRYALTVYRQDPQWLAPPLWTSEFLNVCAGYVRRGQLSIDEALSAVVEAKRLVLAEVPDAHVVLSLIPTSPCSSYDLEFVALAKQLGVPLVTNDRQVLEAFPGLAVSPEAFAA